MRSNKGQEQDWQTSESLEKLPAESVPMALISQFARLLKDACYA